jgi:hypothetical protein
LYLNFQGGYKIETVTWIQKQHFDVENVAFHVENVPLNVENDAFDVDKVVDVENDGFGVENVESEDNELSCRKISKTLFSMRKTTFPTSKTLLDQWIYCGGLNFRFFLFDGSVYQNGPRFQIKSREEK